MEFDGLTLDTIKEIWLPLLPYILGFGIIAFIALFLTRPHKAYHYAYKLKIMPRNRFSCWIRSLWRFHSKTPTYALYGCDRHITEPTNEARISAVGSNIDRFANKLRPSDYAEGRADWLDGFDTRAASDFIKYRSRKLDGSSRNFSE